MEMPTVAHPVRSRSDYRSFPDRSDRRERAIADLRKGKPLATVARTHGVSRATLYNWLKTWLDGGRTALTRKATRHRHAIPPTTLIQAFLDVASGSDPAEGPVPILWSWRDVQCLLQERFDVFLQRTQIIGLLRQAGIPPTPRAHPAKPALPERGLSPSRSARQATAGAGTRMLWLRMLPGKNATRRWVFQTPRGLFAIGRCEEPHCADAIWCQLERIAKHLNRPLLVLLGDGSAPYEVTLTERVASTSLPIAIQPATSTPRQWGQTPSESTNFPPRRGQAPSGPDGAGSVEKGQTPFGTDTTEVRERGQAPLESDSVGSSGRGLSPSPQEGQGAENRQGASLSQPRSCKKIAYGDRPLLPSRRGEGVSGRRSEDSGMSGMDPSDGRGTEAVRGSPEAEVGVAPPAASRSRKGQAPLESEVATRAERLAKALLIEIASGFYTADRRFLSHRRIRREWRVGRKTVDAAIVILRQHGLLVARPRSGCYVCERAVDRARLLLSEITCMPLEHSPAWVSRRQRMRLAVGHFRSLPLLVVDDDQRHGMPPLTTQQWLDAVKRGWIDPTGTYGLRVALFRRALEMDLIPEYMHYDGSAKSHSAVEDRLEREAPAGVVVIRQSDMDFMRLFTLLSRQGIPSLAVLHGRDHGADAAIDFNHIAAGKRMMRELLNAGHRRILMLTPSQPHARFVQAEAGALQFAQSSPFRKEIGIVRLIVSRRAAKRTASRLREIFMASPRPPTAILATGIHCFTMIHDILDEIGVSAPGSVAVVGRGHPSGRAIGQLSPVSLVEQNMDSMGLAAATLARQLIDGHEVPHFTLLDMPFLDRGSISPPALMI